MCDFGSFLPIVGTSVAKSEKNSEQTVRNDFVRSLYFPQVKKVSYFIDYFDNTLISKC